jgi:hypothetical protein
MEHFAVLTKGFALFREGITFLSTMNVVFEAKKNDSSCISHINDSSVLETESQMDSFSILSNKDVHDDYQALIASLQSVYPLQKELLVKERALLQAKKESLSLLKNRPAHKRDNERIRKCREEAVSMRADVKQRKKDVKHLKKLISKLRAQKRAIPLAP